MLRVYADSLGTQNLIYRGRTRARLGLWIEVLHLNLEPFHVILFYSVSKILDSIFGTTRHSIIGQLRFDCFARRTRAHCWPLQRHGARSSVNSPALPSEERAPCDMGPYHFASLALVLRLKFPLAASLESRLPEPMPEPQRHCGGHATLLVTALCTGGKGM